MNAVVDTGVMWLAALATIATLAFYEIALAIAQRRWPARLARTAHAGLREDWFIAVSAHQGTEVLAVQTLRNALMSASMTASTAVLGLMGAISLAAPSLNASFGAAQPRMTPRLLEELVLVALLFASLVACAMAVRYYNHAGFVAAMPVESAERARWRDAGIAYVRRAGLYYSWGWRQLLLVAPVLASILHPLAGPPAALVLVTLLFGFDRFTAPIDSGA